MTGYAGLIGGNDFSFSLMQFLTTLINFIQTPIGIAFIVFVILCFVFKR